MQSLGGGLRRVGDTGRAGAQGGRRTLIYSNLPPRRRSRLGRLLGQLAQWTPPPRLGLYCAAGLLAATGAYGSVLGGHVDSIRGAAFTAANYVTARSGFAIETVIITGHKEVRERDVLKSLGIDEATSLLTFDPHWARQRLAENAWVKDATVQKLFPATLRIDLVEREPYALWQIGGIVSLIDRGGQVIGELADPRFAGLPLVVGYGANERADELMALIAPHPGIAARFRAAVRVADRRWNLVLDNGVEIRLPEEGAATALADLDRLDRTRGVISRDIVAIDLRLADRIVVRLSDQAAMQRKANLKAREEDRKRKGANT